MTLPLGQGGDSGGGSGGHGREEEIEVLTHTESAGDPCADHSLGFHAKAWPVLGGSPELPCVDASPSAPLLAQQVTELLQLGL